MVGGTVSFKLGSSHTHEKIRRMVGMSADNCLRQIIQKYQTDANAVTGFAMKRAICSYGCTSDAET